MVPSGMARWTGWGFLAVLAACTGSIGGEPGEMPEPEPTEPEPLPPLDCSELQPGRAPMRRLTVAEYDATIEALLGDTTRPATRIIDDERGVTSADARIVTPLLAEQYLEAAEDVAARATPDLLGCDIDARGEAECAGELVDDFAFRAFRRPVTSEERDTLLALHAAVAETDGFADGVRAVVEAVLQSPGFLYRAEIIPTTGAPVVRLDGWQLASRLSYLLWGTMPDDALFAAAASGDLDTDAGVEEQARRLMASPRALGSIREFVGHWVELEQLEGLDKDPAVFPDYDAEVADLMRQETEAFIDAVMSEDGSWTTLLTADWSMMNARLAAYYGVDEASRPAGDAFERVELDGDFHSGLLTQGALMATRARTYESSPIHRGMFIRGGVLCGEVPDLPEGIEVTAPDPDPSLTTRQRLSEHRENEICGSCHRQMDPLGFAFEHFDGAGRFRMDENDLPIDATGDIVESDIDGSFDGAPDMARRLVGSEDAQACFAGRYFRFAQGRATTHADGCSLEALSARFREAEFDVRELVVAITQTDAFLYRAVDQDQFIPEESP